jgi:hypothetical protein
MADIAKKYKERLKDIKEAVEQSQQYFQDNVNRYHDFMRFVFKSSMTNDEEATLRDLGKPTIEFNILEAYISRLRGEFSKQQPSLTVRAADGVPLSMLTKDFIETIDVIEAHLRAIFFDASNDKLEYNVYSDLLAGGFSVMEVYTDYVSEMSFEQNIYVDRVFDPTLTGFDPLARESHKGDGKYCFQLYPKTRKQFEEEYGKELTEKMSFTRNLAGFGWSYKNDKEDIILVCDYYEKIRKKEKILKLSNGHTVTQKEYDRFIDAWEKEGIIAQPPIPVGEPRWTFIEQIVRYRLCESEVIDYKVTNYKQLPLVFVDGNSVNLTQNEASYQMTRPYVYHAKGIQRLKNFAGQSLGNEIENTVQNKWIVAIESIPVEYTNAYTNVQKSDALIYNHFLDTNNPTVTLPPPREVNRTPIPPEISNTFRMSDEMTQTILGTYDSAMGIQGGDISGVAIANGAMQSNNASMPYIVGYIKGLNRVAQIILDLIPKYYRTPRSLPVLLPSGKRDYQIINKSGSLFMNYDPNSMQVKVETGVNFAMQKEIALKTIISLMQSSELFAQFMNTKGLPLLLDNIEIRGIDELKEKAEEFQKEMEQKMAQQQAQEQQAAVAEIQLNAQQQQMAMADAERRLNEPTEIGLGMMAIQEKAQKDAAEIAIRERDSETRFIDMISKVRDNQVDNELKREKAAAENLRSSVELMSDVAKNIGVQSTMIIEEE